MDLVNYALKNFLIYLLRNECAPWPVPEATRSKAWVYGRRYTGIAGSNPVRGHRYLSPVSFVQIAACVTS